MNKVLFIRSNPVSPDPRIEKEATILSNNGYNVEVLSWDRLCIYPISESKGLFKINRIRIKAKFGKISLIFKLPFWLIREFQFIMKNNPDIIHACDFDTLIPALIISRLRNRVLIYDSFDFYADCLPNNIPPIARKVIANAERFFSSFADLVILADASREVQFGNKLNNFIVFNNVPILEQNVANLYDMEDTERNYFVIFYAGILDKTRGIIDIINIIKDMPQIKLIVAGFGTDEEEIKASCIKYDNIDFLGIIEYPTVIQLTKKCNLLFALYDPSIPNNKYASPNKLFEAMMCKKPILVSDNSRMAEIVNQEECGIVVPYGDTRSIRDSIIKLKNNTALCEKLGANGWIAYKDKYNPEIMKKRLIEGYCDCLKRRDEHSYSGSKL